MKKDSSFVYLLPFFDISGFRPSCSLIIEQRNIDKLVETIDHIITSTQ